MIIALLKKKIVICVKNLQHKPKRYDVKTEKSILFMDFLLFQQPRSIYLFLHSVNVYWLLPRPSLKEIILSRLNVGSKSLPY